MDQVGVYLLTPYLLTAALGMELTRRIHGRDGMLACGAAAAAISVSGPLAVNIRPALYQLGWVKHKAARYCGRTGKSG